MRTLVSRIVVHLMSYVDRGRVGGDGLETGEFTPQGDGAVGHLQQFGGTAANINRAAKKLDDHEDVAGAMSPSSSRTDAPGATVVDRTG